LFASFEVGANGADPARRFRDVCCGNVEFRAALKISDPRKHWLCGRKGAFSMFTLGADAVAFTPAERTARAPSVALGDRSRFGDRGADRKLTAVISEIGPQ
jgi:hypothetical protein